MNDFLPFFPVFFIAMWVLAVFIISKMGWSKLAAEYRTDADSFTGTDVGPISAKINSINYNNCLVLKYNDQGILLKTIFLFRLFHPPILIPWNEIREVEDKKILVLKFKKLTIGSPLVATIMIRTSTFEAFEPEFILRSFANKHT